MKSILIKRVQGNQSKWYSGLVGMEVPYIRTVQSTEGTMEYESKQWTSGKSLYISMTDGEIITRKDKDCA